jgi:ketosteroid isomerase-like protein
VAERSKAAVLKTAERKLRGFESLLLRKADNRIARSSFFLRSPAVVRAVVGEMAEWLKAPVC